MSHLKESLTLFLSHPFSHTSPTAGAVDYTEYISAES